MESNGKHALPLPTRAGPLISVTGELWFPMALIKTLNVCSDNVAQRIQSYGSLSPSVLLNNELLDRIRGQTRPHASVDTSGDLAW